MRFDTTGGLSNAVLIRAALAAVCLLAAGAAAPAQPVPFATGTVEYRTLADERRFDGRVEAVYRSTISAQTGGEIIELPFDVNDYVPKGAVVLRFDDTTQKAALDKAVASEMEAESRLAEARAAHQRNLRLIKENAVSRSSNPLTGCSLPVATTTRAASSISRLARRLRITSTPCVDRFCSLRRLR